MNTSTELLKAIAENLSALSVLLNNLAAPADEKLTQTEQKQEVKEEPKKPAMTYLDLRKKLGAYSIAGFTETIQKIIRSHGVKLLKELPEDQYEVVLKEVQEACD